MAHYPAAFINEIDENGTKEEAVKWLQYTWNDYMETSNKLVSVLERMREVAQALDDGLYLRASQIASDVFEKE